MTSPAGPQIRARTVSDAVPTVAQIRGNGFILEPKGVKIFNASGAPVLFYDVLPAAGEPRIGIASLIVEPDPSKVADVGHIGVQVPTTSSGQDLLQEVAGVLLQQAFRLGLQSALIVSAKNNLGSVRASNALGPQNASEFVSDGERELCVFEYRP